MTKEVRTATNQMEVRMNDDNLPVISGYALKFDTWSKPIFNSFKETLDKRCLDKTDMTDTVALFNHDYNQVLGRVGTNLILSVDDVGLRFDLMPTDTSYSRDLITNMRAGIIGKCSFGFTVADDGQTWYRVKDGLSERTITNIDKLYDISIVTDPAYDDTQADVRSWELQQQHSRDSDLIELDMTVYG